MAINATEKAALDRALFLALAAHPDFLGADALLLYLPTKGEPDLTPLLELALKRAIPVYLPHCDENGMRFLQYTKEHALVRDRFGILAPKADAKEAVPSAKTLCVIPGLAADQSGTRLGYGGGFYDRFLPRFAGKLLFPVYSRFVFDALPRAAYDFLIDPARIMTEKGVLGDAEMDTRTSPL